MIPLLLLVFHPSFAASYTTILNLEDLTESSSKVVSGKVISMTPKVLNGKIYTTVTMAVDTTYVGAKSAEYSFDVLGGTSGDLTLNVSGAPKFNIGESALVFANHKQVVGFGQGVFEVKEKSAHRGFGVNIKKGPDAFNIDATLPNETEARDCLQIKANGQYSEEWALRTIDTSNSNETDLNLFPITVLKGNTYQFIGCSESKAGEMSMTLVTQSGDVIAQEEEYGPDANLTYHANDTQRLYIAVKTMELQTDAVKAAFSLGVMYK